MRTLYLAILFSQFLLIAKAQCPISASGNTSISCGQTSTLTATGATTYTWFPGGMTGSSIVVSPGVTTTYSVAGSTGGCNDSTAITVVVTSTVSVSITASNYTVCYGQPVTLTASGATSYTWNLNGATSPTCTVYPYAVSNYTVMGETGGCIGSQTVSVYGTLLSPSISYTNAGCNGVCNGAMSIIVTGGTSPYTYQWNMGSAAQTVQGLCSGSYFCSVTDATGCNAQDSAWINGNNLILFTSTIPAACGQSNGSIIVDSVQTGSNLVYNLNGGTYGTSNIFSGLSAGVYTVSTSDQTSGCYGSAVVTLNNSNFNIQLTPTYPTCNQCDGSLTGTITGGSAPYTYSWNTGASNASISSLCTGNYQLSVTDVNGCFSSAMITLANPNAPQINIDTIINVTCAGVTSGSASVTATGGIGPYTYSWNTTPVQTTPGVTGLVPGYYQVTVTDNAGCPTSQWLCVANNNNIYIYSSNVQPVNCSNNNGSISISAAGGTAPFTYAWSNGDSGTALTGLSSGTYSVTITDALGCIGTSSVTVSAQCVNVIRGKIFNDLNQNCVLDGGESGMSFCSITVNNGQSYGFTDNAGNFIIYTTAMSNTLSVYPNASYFSPTCLSVLTVNFSNMGDTISNYDIGMWANPNYVDLSIHPGWSGASPGFAKNYWIYYSNFSPTSQNVLVRLTYDSAIQYVGCNSGGVHFPSQHKIEWTFNNVPANKSWDLINDPRADFIVPATVPITADLNTMCEILPVSGDANPGDNVVSSAEPVTGSRDPNEKTVYPSGNITLSDSLLQYTVHFQNNGNDTAYRVVVIDTLSPFVDPATIVPGAANYEYKFNLSGQGICTWTFDSIMLPDSLTNEPASNGYFTYTVKQKPNNPLGSVIKNTAYIYFDFNPAVVTNTTINTITSAVAIPEYGMNTTASDMAIYPNPTSDRFAVRYKTNGSGPVQIEILNIMGALIISQTDHSHKKGTQLSELSAAGLSNGVYLVRVIFGGQQQTQKLIIQK